MTRRSLRALLALVLVALAAISLAACGDDSSKAKALLKQTFSGGHHVRSGNLTVSLNLTAQGSSSLRGPISVTLTGPFQSQGGTQIPKFDLTAAVNAQGQNISAGAVSTGDQGFVKFQGTNYVVPANVFDQFKTSYVQTRQRNQSSQQTKNGFKKLGIDPLDWLKNPKIVGNEAVAGVQTIHIKSQIDVSKFVDDISRLVKNAGSLGVPNANRLPSNGLTAAQKKKLVSAIKKSEFDVWTGKDDKILRKFQANVSAASNGKSSDFTFAVQIANLDQPQTVSAPTSTKPLSQLTSQLGSLGALGGLNGLGGGSGGSGATPGAGGAAPGSGATPGAGGAAPSTGGATSDKVKKYTACLQQAQGDIAKTQACASLLNK